MISVSIDAVGHIIPIALVLSDSLCNRNTVFSKSIAEKVNECHYSRISGSHNL